MQRNQEWSDVSFLVEPRPNVPMLHSGIKVSQHMQGVKPNVLYCTIIQSHKDYSLSKRVEDCVR